MAVVDPAAQDTLANYKLMMGLIVPRPIAWVTTLNEEGKVNLAPFSAFTFLSPIPPIVGISVGINKDTAVNIRRTGEFVVHIADTSKLTVLHESSAEHPPHISEAELLGLETVPGLTVAVPRLADVPAAMECRLHSVTEFGALRGNLIAGEVTSFYVADHLLRDGKVYTDELDPLARVAGPRYAGIGPVTTLRALNAPPPNP